MSAGLVGLQGAALVVLAAVLVIVAATDRATDSDAAYLVAGLYAVAGAGLVLVTRGLFAGRRWARAPALAWQILMLPVGWSLLFAQPVVGAVLLASVIAIFLAVISTVRAEFG